MRARSAAFLLLLAGASLCGAAEDKPKTPDEIKGERVAQEYRELASSVDLAQIERTFRDVAAFGPRLAGSEGEAETLAYAERRFRELGLRGIRRHTFRVTVPDPDAVGELASSDGRWRVPVYPMWPNLVRTSTCDVQGRVVYGGDGSLEFLAGREVKGSIVLMEFNSAGRWRNAAKLGAKAVVFLSPRQTLRMEAEQRFSSVPLNVPRFYLETRLAGPVLEAATRGATARLSCVQRWIVRESANVIGELPGTDRSLAGETIELFVPVDSMCVVPKMAYGAEGIGNLAAALELVRIYRQREHRRPLRVIASGSHALALQGAREYVDDWIRNNRPATLLTVTLDLASGNRALGVFGRGFFVDYRWEVHSAVASLARILRKHAERMAPILGAPDPRNTISDTINQQDNRWWSNNIPTRFAFDCEMFLMASANAVTMATIDDSRPLVDTPLDTLENVNPLNILRQTQTLACAFLHLLNDTSAKGATTDFRLDLEPAKPKRMTLTGGFAVVEGRVVRYDPLKSFVPDVPVAGSLAVNLNANKTMMGVRGDMVTTTEGEQAHFRFVGVAPTTCYYQGWGSSWVRPTRLAAFHIAPNGEIDQAPADGLRGSMDYPRTFELKTGFKSTPIVVFPCVATNFYDLVDPQDLKALTDYQVLDAATDAPPENFGFFRDDKDMRINTESEETAVMFTMPGQRFKLLMGTGLGEVRLILTNADDRHPAGKGYLAFGASTAGATGRDAIAVGGVFPFVALQTARDILAINQDRLNKFSKYRIVSKGVEDLQATARDEASLAEGALADREWPAVDQHSRAAWGYALRAHPVIQGTANDVVNGVVFYLFLIIPFSYFLERLLFGSRSLTAQLVGAAGVFFASFGLLYVIHPAFEIVTNPSMIFIAFVMGALSIIVIGFILGKFESSLKALKKAQSGVHEVDIRRMSVAMAAFNLGVSNMRRRKARTFLTTLTLVVMTFIVLSFTSIVNEIQLKEVSSDVPARYTGMLFRDPGLNPLPTSTYYQVANEFSGKGKVARRAWYYGAGQGDNGVLSLRAADRTFDARVLVGMDPSEAEITRPQEALLPGGRWFRNGDRKVVILPRPIAEELKISPKEVGKAVVQFAGIDYTVIGILDPAILRSIIDLDGDEVLPADFSLSSQFQMQSRTGTDAFRKFIRYDPARVFFMPADTAIGLGAQTRYIAVSLPAPDVTERALKNLMPRIRLNVYAAAPGPGGKLQVKQFSAQQASSGTGIGLVILQMLIASVFVLNTMIASVHERTREIGIFSAIGLAPNHIAMLFFAESLVYGVIGAVFGYFAAQISAKVIVATGALPGLYLNFSSTSAVLSAALVMAVVLASTIYPAKKASKIAAPALEGDLLDVLPEGDEWRILLPFSISGREAEPIIRYLADWFRAYEEYTIGSFVTSGTTLGHFESRHGRGTYTRTTAWIAPYDLGVSQIVQIQSEPTALEDVFELTLILTRLGGEPGNWINLNKRFVEDLRKQFLTWRTMDEDQRARYADARPDEEGGLPAGQPQPAAP